MSHLKELRPGDVYGVPLPFEQQCDVPPVGVHLNLQVLVLIVQEKGLDHLVELLVKLGLINFVFRSYKLPTIH